MRSVLIAVAVVALVALGVLGMVLGEADDSPGLQGIGGLLILGALALGVRAVRRGRVRPSAGR
jgi:VIT1/CCC1 family predicted Fe2+/Mn2+ transporter